MFALLPVLLLVLTVSALVDIITRQDGEVKHLPKVGWIVLVVILPLVGSIVWFAVGREYTRPAGLGSFGDPRRSEQPVPAPRREYRDPQATTTEDQLAALDREIELHERLARIRELNAQRDERGEASA
jgi:hypothetical protein